MKGCGIDNKEWRGVPIEVLHKYLAGQPTHIHKMVVNEQGEVVETKQVDGQPPEVIQQPSEE